MPNYSDSGEKWFRFPIVKIEKRYRLIPRLLNETSTKDQPFKMLFESLLSGLIFTQTKRNYPASQPTQSYLDRTYGAAVSKKILPTPENTPIWKISACQRSN